MREELAIANRYGNVDLTRTKLGRRYVHVRGKRLQPLCRKLKIRYAEAVVEFEGESRYGWRAVTDGVVISVRSHTKLLEAIKQREERNPPEKREAARKRREQARAKRAEERLKKLREAGIYDPTSRTAKWFLRDDISELEAMLIQFKTYYRHEHTDYEQKLASLKKQAQQLHGASRRMAYEFIQQDARGMATEHPIPSVWEEYLDTYDFPFPDIAEALANVLRSPEAAHPIWFCKAILAVKSQGVDLDNLSYEVIQEAIIDWWNERIDSTHSVV